VAIAVSQDGAYVAYARPGSIAIIDLDANSPVKSVGCACIPTTLDRLAGRDVFRLNRPSNRHM
jgi:hypothetical protein